jgi:hypothetical protein
MLLWLIAVTQIQFAYLAVDRLTSIKRDWLRHVIVARLALDRLPSTTPLGVVALAAELAAAGIWCSRLFSDDPRRFVDDCGLEAFAGCAPIARASGRHTSITHRRVKNNRLAAAGFIWSLVAIPRPGSGTKLAKAFW